VNVAVILILTFVAGNNPPTAAAMQEFSSLQACHNAGQQAATLLQDLPHVRVRYVCVPKGPALP
jgi:hypothetical protein